MQDLTAGETVKAARQKRGWSQQALATKADISLRTLVSLEGGKDGHLTTLRKVAAALGEPLVVILGEHALREAHGLCLECDRPTFGPCEHRPAVAAS